jgi:hypothetical protein
MGHNSNETALDVVYEDMVLSKTALEANFVLVTDKAARFRILPQLSEDNSEVMLALDPEGEPEEYLPKGKKKKAYSYRHMIGNWMQRVDILRVYHNHTVTTLCTDVSTSRDGDVVKGGSPAQIITEKVKWKAREQHYRNRQGLPFDETVPKHWIRWVGLNPDSPEIRQSQSEHPDMSNYPFPSTNFMVQTLFWESGEEPLSGQRDENGNTVPAANVIFCIPKSAWKVFEIKIAQRRVNNQPLTPANCKFGDFITLENGQMLTTYKVDDTKYDLDVDYNTGAVPLTAEQVAKWWRPWRELINVMTYEDNILELGKVLGESTVGYGLLGSPYEKYCPTEWLEAGKLINRSYKKDELAAMAATGLTATQAATPQVGQAPATAHQAATPAAAKQQAAPAAQNTGIVLPPQPGAGTTPTTSPQPKLPEQQPAAAAPVTNVATVAVTAAPAGMPAMAPPEQLQQQSSGVAMPPEVATAGGEAPVDVDKDKLAGALERFENSDN